MELRISSELEAGELAADAKANAREVTLVFCDIAEFTQLTERLGDLLSYRIVKACQARLSALVTHLGGELLEVRGDGFLFAFASAEEAAICSVAIQQALAGEADLPIQVRIGMHTGPVIRDQAGCYGRTVIAAFRVSSLAHPDEILMSEETRGELPRSGFRFGRGRSVKLKGLARRYRVWQLRWRDVQEAAHSHLGTGGSLLGVAHVGSPGPAEAGAVGH